MITFGGCHSEYVHMNDVNIFYLNDFVTSDGKNSLVVCEKLNFEKGACIPSTRWGHAASMHNDQVYILGGRNEIDVSDLYSFDPETKKWTEIQISQRVPKPRRRHSAVFVASSLIMFGGFDGDFYNDLYALHLNEIRKNEVRISKSTIDREFASIINCQK